MNPLNEWKDIVGYEGYYQIDINGNIKSLRTGEIRKPVLNKRNGYLTVVLCGYKKKTTEYVHRLVAKTFIENPHQFKCVNHINEIKTDNRVENLEWCTQAYNNKFNNKDQRSCKAILQIEPNTGECVEWTSARKAHNYGIANYKNISACCRGKRKTAGGYEWRFA